MVARTTRVRFYCSGMLRLLGQPGQMLLFRNVKVARTIRVRFYCSGMLRLLGQPGQILLLRNVKVARTTRADSTAPEC